MRVARSLAQVPLEQQVAAWRAAQEKAAPGEAGEEPEPSKPKQRSNSPSTGSITRALRRFDTEPAVLATALRKYLGDDGVTTLLAALETSGA